MRIAINNLAAFLAGEILNGLVKSERVIFKIYYPTIF